MHDWESLSYVRWDYKYHVVIVPKYRKRVLAIFKMEDLEKVGKFCFFRDF